MTELKLSELKGLLPNKGKCSKHKEWYSSCEDCYGWHIRNKVIDDLSTKNLLDYVETVVCPRCKGRKVFKFWTGRQYDLVSCQDCDSTGAVIRVKEGK